MAVKFNPFTGQLQLDQVGAGGGGGGGSSYLDGEVATYNDLFLDGTAAINSAWLVREASGTWLIGRKPAGIYIRTATGGTSRDADYTYAGILPDVFNDNNFLLYDNADSTKNLQFQLSGISSGTTRTLTVPNASGTIALTSDITSGVTSVTGTAPISSSGGTTPAISISAATTSAAGSMSSADKTKLDGIASGAEVNVNADWNASSGDAQILNKPTLGGAATLNVGTTAGTVAAGDDARLSDSRTPTAHAASHAAAGSDPVFDQDLNTTDSPTFAGLVLDGSAQLNVGALAVGGTNLFIDVGGVEIEAGLPINFVGASAATNAATTLTNLGAASDDHAHGNLTNDGKVGSTAGLPLVTTAAGAVTTLALGTAGQVLTVNSGANGVEFAAASGGGGSSIMQSIAVGFVLN